MSSTNAFLLVQAAGRCCALPLAPGMEVLRVPLLQPESHAAAVTGMLGLTQIRGELAPVLDLAVLLGFEAGGELPRMVAVQVNGRTAALAVEDVVGVRMLVPESLQTLELPGTAEQTVGRFDEGFARVIAGAGLVPPEVWAESGGSR